MTSEFRAPNPTVKPSPVHQTSIVEQACVSADLQIRTERGTRCECSCSPGTSWHEIGKALVGSLR